VELTRLLSYQGYTDEAITWLIGENQRTFHRQEMESLWRQGVYSDDEIIGLITGTGVDPATASQVWAAWQEELSRPVVHQYLSESLHSFRSGFQDRPAATRNTAAINGVIDGLHLSPPQAAEWKHLFGQVNELERKHLTEAEMERAYLGGIIDLSGIQDFWGRLGYSTESLQTLTLLLLQKQATGNRTRAGHTPHKILTEAQAEKAYKAGIINLAQIQSYWHAMGYSPDDITVLSALVELKVPAPGTTEFPGLTTP
jgi:hypothetical protein